MSSNGAVAAAAGARVPFRFPFNPPANALPISDANYLTPTSLWSNSQINSGVSALVRLAIALLATGAAVKLFRAPKPTRRLRPADVHPEEEGGVAGAKGKRAHSPSGRASPAPHRHVSASPVAAAAAAGKGADDLDSSWATAGQDNSAAVEASVHASAASESTSHADAAGHIVQADEAAAAATAAAAAAAASVDESSYESEPEAAAPAILSTPQRRRTTAPEYSHIDSIQKKERKSARKSLAPGRATPASPVITFSSPSKVVEEQRAQANAAAAGVDIPQGPALPPFSLGIITPRSLEHYANLLKDGFDALMARQQAQSGGGDSDATLRSVEICMPDVNESAATFSARIRSTKRFDVLLIQYHGSQAEDPIAFVEYSQSEETPRILLLHRPEEILQRHEQHVFKDAQFNVVKLLREVDVVVLLGEAARPTILKQFAEGEPGNVCVVPHGFSALLSDEQLRQPKNLAPIAVVGAHTTWSDMRWLADLIELRQAIEKRNAENAAAAIAATTAAAASGKKRKGKQQPQVQGAQQVLVYAAGNCVSYTHPTSKDAVDELRRLQAECPEELVVVSAESLDAVAGITDVASLKRHLWTLSESGRKVVLCRGVLSARLSALHADLFDFHTQLFRELMMDYRPKIEYSGSLHAHPGAAIPIVFASPAMDDVEIEGMQLLTVAYPDAADAQPSATSSSSSAAAAAAAPSSSKWYSSASYVPDFTRAVDGIFQYLRQPAHYNSHRLAVAEAAAQLSMRHIAAQYEQIIKVIFNMQ